MKRKSLLISVKAVCLLVCGMMCLFSYQKQVSESKKQNDEISIKFYPTGVEQSVRYSIDVRNDTTV